MQFIRRVLVWVDAQTPDPCFDRDDFIRQFTDGHPIQSFRGLHLFYNYSEAGFEYLRSIYLYGTKSVNS